MDELIAFLRARLDEDEQVARDASVDVWRKAERPSIWVSCEDGPVAQTKYFEDAAHIVRHDPARVLREVDAKRRIIGEYEAALDRSRRHPGDVATSADLLAMVRVVKLLGLPYADHEDYREKRKP